MKIFTTIADMRQFSLECRKQNKTIGFVPTMGALHEGHLSLVNAARQLCDVVVMSIFVNPAQFGPKEDFAKYPRPFEADCAKAEAAGCAAVFAPLKSEMYPDGFSTSVFVNGLSDVLCGSVRPGHFGGVAVVVLKFFNIVAPDVAVFGQKDAQQCIIIKRMVKDLNVPVSLHIVPTKRESDGLAKSSRNVYLTQNERQDAPLIYQSLLRVQEEFSKGNKSSKALQNIISQQLSCATAFTPEYIEIVDTEQLTKHDEIRSPALVAIAVRTKESNTRLIDNIVLGGAL